jgi:hypothetical protein
MYTFFKKNFNLTYPKAVYDIVQFGSSLYAKQPNDIDIAVVFTQTSIKEQLEITQHIKKQLQIHTDIPIHAKPLTIQKLFSHENFARKEILHKGYSLQTQQPFSKQFGLLARTDITYNLEGLPKKDKVKLHYQLRGRADTQGTLDKKDGVLLAPGRIRIQPKDEQYFVHIIAQVTTNITIEHLFISEE